MKIHFSDDPALPAKQKHIRKFPDEWEQRGEGDNGSLSKDKTYEHLFVHSYNTHLKKTTMPWTSLVITNIFSYFRGSSRITYKLHKIIPGHDLGHSCFTF